MRQGLLQICDFRLLILRGLVRQETLQTTEDTEGGTSRLSGSLIPDTPVIPKRSEGSRVLYGEATAMVQAKTQIPRVARDDS